MLRATIAGLLVVVSLSTRPAYSDDPNFKVDEGFVSLFDGASLKGWTGSLSSYAAENGELVSLVGGKGNLLTEKEYGDFVIKFEFKLTPGANNGLGIRCPKVAEGNLDRDGMELQILDDSAEKHRNLKPYQYHGSVYGIVAAKQPSALKPVGDWNHQEVTANGRRVKVVLNDVTIVDADLDDAIKSGTLDAQTRPGALRSRGHIGFLGYGDRVEFRHLQIKELPLPPTSDTLETVMKRVNDKSAVLLDVREPAEWNEVHVDGAISLPNSLIQKGLDPEALAKIIPTNKIVYTYCRAGRRALAAGEELSKRGYDVRPLKPGIQELLDAGFPKAN